MIELDYVSFTYRKGEPDEVPALHGLDQPEEVSRIVDLAPLVGSTLEVTRDSRL